MPLLILFLFSQMVNNYLQCLTMAGIFITCFTRVIKAQNVLLPSPAYFFVANLSVYLSFRFRQFLRFTCFPGDQNMAQIVKASTAYLDAKRWKLPESINYKGISFIAKLDV
jgi:hypothetical protein